MSIVKPAFRRIFVAISVPPKIPLYLETLKENNKPVPAIKWMRTNNLHLTIYFIGNIQSTDFEKVVIALREVIQSQKRFTIEFEKISLAPEKNPKMIWARFYKNDSFTKLSNAIHEALNFLVLQNKFHYNEPIPHITLGRFHPLKQTENINIDSSPELSQIHIESCELYESFQSSEGVHYKSVAPVFYLK